MAVQLPDENSPAASPTLDAHRAPIPAPAPQDALLDTDEEQIEPEVGFWQEPWVQNALPFVTSLAIHVTLIVMGFILIEPYIKGQDVSQEQVFVPDASIVEGDVGGIPNPGLGGDPTRPAASDLVPENTQSDGWNKLPSKSLQAAVLGGSGETENNSMIGIGAGQSLGRGTGVGVGSGEGGGSAAPFGVPGGGMGAGPKFMGLGGGAGVKTVAYVCDASGSMLGLPFDLLKVELQKAISLLAPSQAFNIALFTQGDVDALAPTMLVANPNNKSRAYEWLHQASVRANSSPIAALRHVMKQKPDLVYLLTDGDFSGGGGATNEEVIAEIRKLNAQKKTRINTIAFFTPDQPAADRKACENVLRQIAEENGGRFKVVLTTDLTK